VVEFCDLIEVDANLFQVGEALENIGVKLGELGVVEADLCQVGLTLEKR